MREAYRTELDRLGQQVAELAETADGMMNRATSALLQADRSVADAVIGKKQSIDDLHHQLDDHAIELLALQQPVATDLRMIVAYLRISADLQRMAALARHVAELVVLRYPDAVVPAGLRPMIEGMGEVARRLVGKARDVLSSREVEAALALERDDDEMDRLLESLNNRLVTGDWGPDPRAAMDLTLLGRYYERYADHAVSVARRVAFIDGHLVQHTQAT
jgi:phosphate transport system protein